jgi:hypothetical protein
MKIQLPPVAFGAERLEQALFIISTLADSGVCKRPLGQLLRQFWNNPKKLL